MIGKSRAEYIFIRFCIVGLHYLAPLSLCYCALIILLYGFKTAITSPIPIVIESIALAESLFFLLVYVPYRYHLQREAVHPPPPSPEERKELFQLCNDNIPNHEAYLRKWFLGADLSEIKRENVKEFLLWAFFNRGGPPGDDDDELEEYVIATEQGLGKSIEEGRGKAKCLRLTIDNVDMLHRSLVWYFCVGFVDFLTYVKLLWYGFHFHRTAVSRFFTLFPLRPQTLLSSYKSPAKHLTYWHRPHTSTTKLPVVFIHGIGIGLYPYTNFLKELNSKAGVEVGQSDEQVGIICIEVMPVAFRITHAALGREEMCYEIEQIVSEHFGPDQKFVLVSHSYGTVITTHLMKNTATSDRIGAIVLIDPVSILLHLPDVAYNFTRRQPQEANEYQLYYFGSMDMSVSHTLSRHFFWNENVVWKKDFRGRKVTCCLSGQDLIVDTDAVGKYLTQKDENDELAATNGHATGILIDIDDDKSRSDSPGLRLRGGEATDRPENDVRTEEWKHRPWKGVGLDVLWFEDLDHAQVFDKASNRRRIINVIRAYCEDG